MADIKKNLVLVDKFTSIFDRFIAKTEKVNNAFLKQETRAQAAEAVWRKTYESMESEQLGTLGMLDRLYQAQQKLVSAFGEDSFEAIEGEEKLNQALEKCGLTLDDLKEKLGLVGEESEDAGKRAERSITRVERSANRSTSKLGRILRRAGVQLFGLHKIIRLIKQAFERAPDSIAKPWQKLKSTVLDNLARVSTSLLSGMRDGMERLNQAFNSPAGIRLVKFLQVGFEAIGKLIGFVAGKVGEFVEFLGNQITNTGDSLADLFEFIGSGVGAVYVTIHNIVATLWNLFASFAEGILNIFKHPEDALISMVSGVANFALDSLNVVAKAIDKIFGSHLSGTVMGWKDDIKRWAENKYSGQQIELDRMDLIDYDDYMTQFSYEGRKLGEKLSAASLEKTQLQAIKKIESNTSAIKAAVTDEDLKMLIDMATRKFVSHVNLTAQTPVITINGANTGNNEADRKALARAIRDILADQLASNSTTGYYAYQGA